MAVSRVPPGGGEPMVDQEDREDPSALQSLLLDPRRFSGKTETPPEIPPAFLERCMLFIASCCAPPPAPVEAPPRAFVKEIPTGSFQVGLISSVFLNFYGVEELNALFPRVPGKNRFEHVIEKVRYRLMQEADARQTLARKLGVSDDSKSLAEAITHQLSENRRIGERALWYAVKTGLTTVVSEVSFLSPETRQPILENLLSHSLKSNHSPRDVHLIRSLMKEDLTQESNYLVRKLLAAAAQNNVPSITAEVLFNPILEALLDPPDPYPFADAMTRAVKSGHSDVVTQFLACENLHEHFPEGSSYSLGSILTQASASGHATIVSMMLAKEDVMASIFTSDRTSFRKAFYEAAENGHSDIVTQFLACENLHEYFREGGFYSLGSILTQASASGHATIVSMMLGREGVLDEIRSQEFDFLGSALKSAAKTAQMDVVDFFLEHEEVLFGDGRVKPGVLIKAGVEEAAMDGDLKAMQTLLSREYIVRRIPKGSLGEALWWASIQGHVSIIGFLFSSGDLFHKIPKNGYYSFGTALNLASGKNHISIVEKLVSRDEVVECIIKDDASHLGRTLKDLATKNHFRTIQYFLSRRAIAENISGEDYATALEKGGIYTTRILLENPYIREKIPASGYASYESILLSAMKHSTPEVALAILGYRKLYSRIEKEAPSTLRLVLMKSVKKGYTHIVEFLLKRPECTEFAKDSFGKMTEIAIEFEQTKITNALLKKKDVVALIPAKGAYSLASCLQKAIEQDQSEIVKLMLDQIEIIERIHEADKVTLPAILIWAAKHNRLSTLRILLANDNVMDRIPKEGDFSLKSAIEAGGSQEIIDLLEAHLDNSSGGGGEGE